MKKTVFVFLTLASLIISSNYYAQLNGTYIIGPIPSDYTNFSSAVNALTTQGVNGPVIFEVKPATYYEQFILTEINGASTTNTITFQSQLGTYFGVDLYYLPTSSSNNYTIKFDGADHIILRDLTIIASGSNYARVIDISNNSTNNYFMNNRISGTTNTTTDNFALVYSEQDSTSTDTNNVFTENIFVNGSYGILMNGSDTSHLENNNIISDNTFQNQKISAINLKYQNTSIIENNIISTTSTSGFNGIYCYYCDNIQINKNKISSLNSSSSARGIYLFYCDGMVTDYCFIANNFVSVNKGIGIYIQYSNFHKVYYNSVNISGYNYTSSKAYNQFLSGNIFLKNNILSNRASGYSIYNNSSTGLISDYNILFSNGDYIGFWNGNDQTNIGEWQSVSSQDLNSLSIEPQFISSTDLHINYYYPYLNNLGFSVDSILDDIDGETRSITNPDIGADEFSLPGNDLRLLNIINPSENPCPGLDSIKVKFINHGSSTITSCFINGIINNDTLPQILWTGSLNNTDTSNIEWFCNYTFMSDSIYNIKIWISNPNGAIDENNTNDTISNILYSRIVGGLYTVAGTNPDYATIHDAIEELKLRGMCGTVCFNIRSLYDYYNSTIYIPSILGNNELDTIVIQSESGINDVTYRMSTHYTTSMFSLNSVNHITFKNLNLERFYVNDDGNTILTSSGCKTINLIANHFKSETQGLTSLTESYGIMITLNAEKSVVTNNTFQQGTVALIADVDTLYMCNNMIIDQIKRGVDISNADTLLFSYNKVKIMNITNYQGLSTKIDNCDKINIHHNYLGSTKIEGCIGSNYWNRVYNNVFYDDYFGYYWNYDDGYEERASLELKYCDSLELISNTIVCNIQATGGRDAHALYVYSNINQYQKWLNNIIINKSISSMSNSAYYSNIVTVPLVSDYNDFFSLNGTNIPITNNNVQIDANFTDSYLNHNTIALLDIGTPINYIIDDIDYNPRDTLLPDIGAHEMCPFDRTITSSNVDCYNMNNGSIDVAVSGSNPPYSYIWNTNDTTQDLSGLSPATYYLTITDNQNCKVFNNVTITQPDSLTLIMPPFVYIECYSENTGSINTNVYGGTPGYTFNWTDSTGTFNSTSQNIDSLYANTYFLTVTDQNGCTTTSNLTINQSSQINLELIPTSESCYPFCDGSIMANCSGGHPPYYYEWSSSQTNAIIYGLCQGNYTLTLTDGIGCTIIDSTIITGSTLLQVSIIETIPATCGLFNGEAEIEISGGAPGYNISWTTGGVNLHEYNLPPGVINVSIYDSNNCHISINITIPMIPEFAYIISSTNDDGSGNGTASVSTTGGTPPYIYQWDDSMSQVSPTAINLSSGWYHVTITDSIGCIKIDSIEVYFGVGNEILSTKYGCSIYPNPTKGSIKIIAKNIEKIEIVSTEGKQIYQGKETEIDLSQESEGVYFIKIITKKHIITEKLIKQ